MIKVLSISLISKKNRQTGKYLYVGVATDGNVFYYVSFPIYKCVKKIDDIKEDAIIKGIIKPEYYAANGIKG